jgi:hypothetical protein
VILCYVVYRKSNDISEGHVTSIFSDKNYTKQENSMKQAENAACYLLHACLLLGFPSNPEDGGNMFLQNIS